MSINQYFFVNYWVLFFEDLLFKVIVCVNCSKFPLWWFVVAILFSTIIILFARDDYIWLKANHIILLVIKSLAGLISIISRVTGTLIADYRNYTATISILD